MIPLPLLTAGLELIRTASSSNEKENQENVVKVFSKFSEDMPDTIDTRPFWKTKTFWSTLISVVVPIANEVFNINLSIYAVSAAVIPLLLFVTTEQWKKKKQ
jgi:hypothetical protein